MRHVVQVSLLFIFSSLAFSCNAAPSHTGTAATTPPGSATSQPVKPEPGDQISPPIKSALKIVFPQAASFTEQHTDHHDSELHTYVAFANQGGKRTTLGVATVVDVNKGKYLLAVDNEIKIIQVVVIQGSGIGEIETDAFLGQFTGKTHDDPLKLGKDIRFNGKDKAIAEALVNAIRHAAQDLQGLYGKAHSHHSH